MAVVNSFITPLQSPSHLLHPFTPSEEGPGVLVEDIPNFRAEGDKAGDKQQGFSSRGHQLRPTKSTESLSSLLKSLPDVVIPETLYNPLPLQCLAAGCLPEAIREEIDRVLKRYSSMETSVSQLQPGVESRSPALAGTELGAEGLSRDLVSNTAALAGAASGVSSEVESEWIANGNSETLGTSSTPREVRS